MLKLAIISFLFVISAAFAAPSVISYQFIIDSNPTNATVVYISPQSTPGIADGLRINITLNETVDKVTIKIHNLSGNFVAPGTPWKETNSSIIIKPDSSCELWKGTSNQCDGSNLTDGNYTVNVTVSYITSFFNSTTNPTQNATSEIQDLSRTIVIDNSPSVSIQSPSGFTKNSTLELNYAVDSSVNFCVREW